MAVDAKCSYCDKTFSNKEELEEHEWDLKHHIRLDKDAVKPHVCSLCNFSTPTLADYSKHVDSDVHRRNVDDYQRLKLMRSLRKFDSCPIKPIREPLLPWPVIDQPSTLLNLQPSPTLPQTLANISDNLGQKIVGAGPKRKSRWDQPPPGITAVKSVLPIPIVKNNSYDMGCISNYDVPSTSVAPPFVQRSSVGPFASLFALDSISHLNNFAAAQNFQPFHQNESILIPEMPVNDKHLVERLGNPNRMSYTQFSRKIEWREKRKGTFNDSRRYKRRSGQVVVNGGPQGNYFISSEATVSNKTVDTFEKSVRQEADSTTGPHGEAFNEQQQQTTSATTAGTSGKTRRIAVKQTKRVNDISKKIPPQESSLQKKKLKARILNYTTTTSTEINRDKLQPVDDLVLVDNFTGCESVGSGENSALLFGDLELEENNSASESAVFKISDARRKDLCNALEALEGQSVEASKTITVNDSKMVDSKDKLLLLTPEENRGSKSEFINAKRRKLNNGGLCGSQSSSNEPYECHVEQKWLIPVVEKLNLAGRQLEAEKTNTVAAAISLKKANTIRECQYDPAGVCKSENGSCSSVPEIVDIIDSEDENHHRSTLISDHINLSGVGEEEFSCGHPVRECNAAVLEKSDQHCCADMTSKTADALTLYDICKEELEAEEQLKAIDTHISAAHMIVYNLQCQRQEVIAKMNSLKAKRNHLLLKQQRSSGVDPHVQTADAVVNNTSLFNSQSTSAYLPDSVESSGQNSGNYSNYDSSLTTPHRQHLQSESTTSEINSNISQVRDQHCPTVKEEPPEERQSPTIVIDDDKEPEVSSSANARLPFQLTYLGMLPRTDMLEQKLNLVANNRATTLTNNQPNWTA